MTDDSSHDTETEDSQNDVLEIAPERSFPEEGPKKGFFGKLKRGLFMTHTEILDKVNAALEGRATVDAETLEFLEEALISADLGVETSLELIDRLRADVKPGQAIDVLQLRERLVDEMTVLLLDAPQPPSARVRPRVTLVVGVNGVGKTTSVAKLARRSQLDGERVLLAAADTFRAAAIEQLELWGERLDVPVIRTAAGGDPAAVVYDALQAAKARKVDHVIVDTAGRLHTKEHLMGELGKIGRVVDREAEGWGRSTVLVLDATTGQNAISQARTFSQVVPVDGVLLAKLDGTAKGGMAVAVARELRLPVLYLGVGEQAEDLVEFRPREFAAALLG
ncbi:MAG TPA: signal recognition particle-docking protein FtsY [Thermoanaerobaculia bacterium]|nr:signal recognition particle-docking protein FtsY [Thermoanaerobaculia bacterium]